MAPNSPSHQPFKENIKGLSEALRKAGDAHHIYEEEELGGVLDRNWPSWYAKYMLNELNEDQVTANQLAPLLEEASRLYHAEGGPQAQGVDRISYYVQHIADHL